MKKILIMSVAVLVFVVLLFVGINLVDSSRARLDIGVEVDDSSLASFSKSVASVPSYERNNGFFRLWSLTEPVNVDIEAEEIFLKYRRLCDPQFDNEKYIKEWGAGKENFVAGEKFKGQYTRFSQLRLELLKKYGTFDSFAISKEGDWAQFLLTVKPVALELKQLSGVYLERYEKVVTSPILIESTLIRKDPLVPHLLAWLQQARLYNIDKMLEAMEGNWESGVSKLLLHVEMAKKAVKGSRTMIYNLIAKAVMRESLHALASLMNQPEFPDTLYDKIIQGLPVLSYEEFGTRVPLLWEGFLFTQSEQGGLFYQKNRTRQYYYNFLSQLVNSETTPPFMWKSVPLEYRVKKGFFWWLQNPAGKAEFEKNIRSDSYRNLFTTVFKAYSLKATYDMVRISAELHKQYNIENNSINNQVTAKKSVPELLQGLETYRSWVDACTGLPYRWNEQKQILYSFGVDRNDDGGKVDRSSMDTDIPVPVVLYIKNK